MTPCEYKTERQKRGTQQGVAALLGVDYHTIQRRESGEIKITREAEIALLSLRKKRVSRKSNTKS
jgi:hypothetical protein